MMDKQDEMGFADMLEGEFKEPVRFEPGEQIEAEVVRVGNSVFLDIGGKSEGYVPKEEFMAEDGSLTVSEGDRIKVFFLSAERSEMLFTTRLGAGTAARDYLRDAHEGRVPVEGTVAREIKGGFEIRLGGSIRAFCPFSQMDIRRIEDPEEWPGQTLTFMISQFEEGGRNIVVSRRQLLEEEQRLLKEKLRETLKPGEVVSGTITSVQDFGAFVDIGGLEGLIPVSEVGWGRVEDIRSKLERGQTVEVAALKLDWENDRFSFSLKQTMPDPWDLKIEQLSEGSMVSGLVVRLTSFGAFVNLAEGVDGLLHISALGGGRRINHPREVVSEGETVEVRIDSIDPEQRRISLTLAASLRAAEEAGREQAEVRRYIKREADTAGGSMGTFGDLFKKKLDEIQS